MTDAGQPDLTGYRELAAHLRRQIRDGVLRPGDRLPSEVALQQTYDLSRWTVREAVDRLRDEGLVDIVRGYGVVVRGPREVNQVRIGPGCRVKASPATAEERERYGEGVAMLEITFPDGRVVRYPGDETEAVVEDPSHGRTV